MLTLTSHSLKKKLTVKRELMRTTESRVCNLCQFHTSFRGSPGHLQLLTYETNMPTTPGGLLSAPDHGCANIWQRVMCQSFLPEVN